MLPQQAMYFRGKLLPELPSQDSDDDIDVGEGCRSTEFLPWKRDLDGVFSSDKAKPGRSQTKYIEWKTAPKRQRPKKELLGSTGTHSNSSLSSEKLNGSKRSERRSGRSSPSSTSTSREENSPPLHEKVNGSKSSDMHSGRSSPTSTSTSRKENSPPLYEHRYSNLQKFKVLSSYYREKMKADDQRARKESESDHDLGAIKKELKDLRKWAKEQKTKEKKKRVQFAHPLISSLKYRPKTRPEDIGDLFFGEDELLDWEEDRETTSPEQVECMIEDEDGPLQLLFEYRSMSMSFDQE